MGHTAVFGLAADVMAVLTILHVLLPSVFPSMFYYPLCFSLWYLKDNIPHHTSALSSAAWVAKPFYRHLQCIKNELNMRKHVFYALIDNLKTMRHYDSRHVTLKKQLSIFLYIYVTRLLICHIGKCFQCSNSTVSKCVVVIPSYPLFTNILSDILLIF
jgi:hypothetical protein